VTSANLMLGIDLGTTYFKAGLFSDGGALLGLGRVAVDAETGAPKQAHLARKAAYATAIAAVLFVLVLLVMVVVKFNAKAWVKTAKDAEGDARDDFAGEADREAGVAVAAGADGGEGFETGVLQRVGERGRCGGQRGGQPQRAALEQAAQPVFDLLRAALERRAERLKIGGMESLHRGRRHC